MEAKHKPNCMTYVKQITNVLPVFSAFHNTETNNIHFCFFAIFALKFQLFSLAIFASTRIYT
jgi:hypothetical protein